MAERTRHMARRLGALWAIVLLGNLAGAFVFAWAMARTTTFAPELREAFRTVSLDAVLRDPMTVFTSGIVAGFVVALMVWMLPAAGTASTVIIIIMTWLIGAAKLSHVIVGAVESFHLVATGDLGAGRALGGYVLPALLGNTIGGVALVAALNHAQVDPDGRASRSPA